MNPNDAIKMPSCYDARSYDAQFTHSSPALHNGYPNSSADRKPFNIRYLHFLYAAYDKCTQSADYPFQSVCSFAPEIKIIETRIIITFTQRIHIVRTIIRG